MSYRFVMTAFGKDRVGFVADVTRLLYENDCNLEDTSMNLLMDEFTISLLFSSSNESVQDQLVRECRRLEMEKGISAFIRQLPGMEPPSQNGRTCTLHIEGLDQSGIVFKTSKFLAERQLNILHLNSISKPSPQSGAPMYNMDIHIQVPEGISLPQLEDELGRVADELQVDISLSR
ncbi:glycine cleavage system protein R [Desulfopila aestuarii]|uniref:Glycine cleavage system transcriptional repressor n=1 Tax=Desulfopila aestuarii DSM 18488 TaxID=1121416 RepID=A0A1M7Y422_9BACT|nr:ACT domain-containing protein [Desulfopila aestuarii]SHO47018.1 glycine cleavage system transcriptional repressor [Desulfopila aestuarii DSM 18488]